MEQSKVYANAPPSYEKLAELKGKWRVDGQGEITSTEQRLFSTVFFSQIKDASCADPYKSNARTGCVEALSLPIAALTHFTIGSVWDGENFVHSPNFGKAQSFLIDTGTAQATSLGAGFSINNAQFNCVPEQYFSLGDNRLPLHASRFTAVRVLNDPLTSWLIVPDTELLRFYIGQSSRLLRAALDGTLNDYVDLGAYPPEALKSPPIIQANQHLNKFEIAIFARAIVSAEARASLYFPHQNLSKSRRDNQTSLASQQSPLTINASFPFSGQTKLTVFGKKIRLVESASENKGPWAMLVMQIQKCSHPLGFTDVEVEYDEPLCSWIEEEALSELSPPTFKPEIPDDLLASPHFTNLGADARLQPLALLSPSNPFEGFSSLRVRYRQSTIQKGNKPSVPHTVPVTGMTNQDGTNKPEVEGIVKVNSFNTAITDVDRDLNRFLKMISFLSPKMTENGWQVHTRLFGDGTSHDNGLVSFFPIQANKRLSWYMTEDSSRPRQIVFVEMEHKATGSFFYLAELELRPKETGHSTLCFYKKDRQKISDTKEVKTLLHLTAVRNRWPEPEYPWKKSEDLRSAKKLFSNLDVHGIPHLSPVELALRVEGVGMTQSPEAHDETTIAWARYIADEISKTVGLSTFQLDQV